MNVISGLTTGGWEFVAGRLTPAFIAVSLFALGVVPDVPLASADGFLDLGIGTQTAIIALVAVVIAFVLDALQRPLYGLLEGYLWPASVRAWGIAHQKRKRDTFLAKHGLAEPTGLEEGLILEQSGRWPILDRQIAPTRLGNRLRAFEVYGWVRFRLDSQTLWYDLETSVPPSLRVALEHARAPVDFCLNAVYLSGVYGLLSILVGLVQGEDRIRLLSIGVVALLLMPGWYAVAVRTLSTGEWQGAVKALVNLGRLPLARALGLQIPATLDEERKMWRSTTRIVRGTAKPEDLDVFDRSRRPD